MALESFAVRDTRNVREAACAHVPAVMVIAGPNGCGKSTLLDALRRQHRGVLYVGPHRGAARQTVQYRHLLGDAISFETILSGTSISGVEGIRLLTGNRDPWSYDDAANFLKHGLCQIEIDRQQAVVACLDRYGEIRRNQLPDPWEPLRVLTRNLLPHLRFDRIDVSNRAQVRCLFRTHARAEPVDFDDLSSGEKSVVQLFYPLLEHQIKARLASMREQGDASPLPSKEVCLVVDEPELHLHPSLQLKVLDYFRILASRGEARVIAATHSPTIVDYATFEELFLLRPAELTADGENQLVPVATDEERLRFLHEQFGTVSSLTALQPVVVVEGVSTTVGRAVPDRKVLRALHEGFDRVTVVPGGGKGECIKLRGVLESALSSFTKLLNVVALLDRDLGSTQADCVVTLPVSMVENFLLDPSAIWAALDGVAVVEKLELPDADTVGRALDRILDEQELREVERRTLASLGAATFRPHAPVGELGVQAADFLCRLEARYGLDAVAKAWQAATTQVQDLRSASQRREFFDGKAVLSEFYERHVKPCALPKGVFVLIVAKEARRRRSVQAFFDNFFASVFPEKTAEPA